MEYLAVTSRELEFLENILFLESLRIKRHTDANGKEVIKYLGELENLANKVILKKKKLKLEEEK